MTKMKDDDDKNLTEHRRNVQAADRAPSQYWMGPRSAGTWSPGWIFLILLFLFFILYYHDHDDDEDGDNDDN